MILYLVTSTLCLTLLLLVYYFYLEEEKMHKFNRVYLLFSLVFSLTIPLIPVGIFDNLPGWGISDPSFLFESVQDNSAAGTVNTAYSQGEISGSITTGMMFKAIFIFYGLAVLMLLARLISNIDSILFRVKRHTTILHGNAVIVLLKEKTIPFSFLDYIFLNEQDYCEGRIKKEVLIHEHTHVRQKHTFDIIFIELLKSLFWFNPVLYFYKRAIQLNHEFLADQAVVSGSGHISGYQSMLLQASLFKAQNILTSNLNFSMTKKRLLMMTRKTSRVRTILKQLSILPLLTGAALLFGCQVTTTETEENDLEEFQTVNLEVIEEDIIKMDGEEISVSMLNDRLASLTQSAGLTVNFKVYPDAYFGTVLDLQKILREYSLKINYSTERLGSANERGGLESFKESVNRYMQMPVKETSIEVLQDKYDDVMKLYNAFHEKQIEIHLEKNMEAPPPPPVPPKPEKRVEMEID